MYFYHNFFTHNFTALIAHYIGRSALLCINSYTVLLSGVESFSAVGFFNGIEKCHWFNIMFLSNITLEWKNFILIMLMSYQNTNIGIPCKSKHGQKMSSNIFFHRIWHIWHLCSGLSAILTSPPLSPDVKLDVQKRVGGMRDFVGP